VLQEHVSHLSLLFSEKLETNSMSLQSRIEGSRKLDANQLGFPSLTNLAVYC